MKLLYLVCGVVWCGVVWCGDRGRILGVRSGQAHLITDEGLDEYWLDKHVLSM